MHSKLSFRLGALIGAIIFCTVLISYLFFNHQLGDLLGVSVKKELRRDLLFNQQLLAIKPNDWESATYPDELAHKIGHALDIRVTIIDLEGHVIGDSSLPPEKVPGLENHRGRTEVAAALKYGYGEVTRFSQTIKEDMLYVAVPIGAPSPYAILRFAKPLYDISSFEAEIRKDMEGALFMALLFSLIAGLPAAFFMLRPLRTLVATADKRLHGDFSGIIPPRHRDEIGQMARAFNFMSNEILKMRRSEEWYRAVVSGIRESIIVTDAAGDIILVNPAASKIFGIDGAMFKSRPLRHLPDTRLQELFANVHSGKMILRKEEYSLTTSKGARIMQITSMPIMKEESFEGTVFVLNDITKLRNLEKVRRDFVASVSHELRTPLACIKGYTETLLEGAMDEPEHAASFLNIILQSTDQLTSLINDVLDLSKIESGRIEFRFEPVDLKLVVAKSVDLLQNSLDKKGIRLDVSIPDDLPPVNGDAGYLEIIVRNLLDNAIKYVDEQNGRVRIWAFKSGENVRLEVEDNGIGISQADLKRIFERFYRADKARSRQLGGTGLGLAIVKHLVLAHKGNVSVRSRLSHGSVFSVVLPSHHK